MKYKNFILFLALTLFILAVYLINPKLLLAALLVPSPSFLAYLHM